MTRDRKAYREELYRGRSPVLAYVPDKVKKRLKTYARRSGQTLGRVLSDFIRDGLRRRGVDV